MIHYNQVKQSGYKEDKRNLVYCLLRNWLWHWGGGINIILINCKHTNDCDHDDNLYRHHHHYYHYRTLAMLQLHRCRPKNRLLVFQNCKNKLTTYHLKDEDEIVGQFGKITLHLLFGWSLDKDEKSLDQSKQFSWQFGSIQTKAFPNPDQPPLEIFLINQYFCTKNKIIDNEKWKLLETLQYTIKEFNNGNVVCSTMHCPNGSRWGGDVKRVARILCIV